MVRRPLVAWIIPLLMLAVWAIVARLGLVPSYFLPSPIDAGRELLRGLANGLFISATASTLGAALLGCLAAAVIGIPLGYLIARNDIARSMFGPLLAASQAIPAVALAPLLVVWMGYGTLPITVLCTIIVIFPVTVTTSLGYRSIDHDILEAAQLDGASGMSLISRIETPLAAPGILAGLRTGFTLSITGAVVGEMVMGGNGLGSLLAASQGSTANVALLFAVIFVLAVLAMVIYIALSWAERRLDPYRKDRS